MILIDREGLMQTLGITDMDCEKCGWYSRVARRCKRGGDFEDACCAIDDAPEVVPEPKWIPCSNPPDTDRNVFIARGEKANMTACIGHYDHDYKQWYEDRNWFAKCLYDGLYWCEIPPLPEPYLVGGENK